MDYIRGELVYDRVFSWRIDRSTGAVSYTHLGCPNLEFVDLRNVKNEDFKKNLKNLSREFNSHTITSGSVSYTHLLVVCCQQQLFSLF